MKVLLINICLRPWFNQYHFPIGIGYIATAIYNAGFELEILDLDINRHTDEEVEELLANKEYDVAAMGCIVTGYKIVKWLSGLIKKYKNVPIICGNTVASSVSHILLRKTDVDIIVMGEGDVTIVELLRMLEQHKSLDRVNGIIFKENGKIIENPLRIAIQDISSLSHINWDLFNVEEYITKTDIREPKPPVDIVRALPINTARGCPFECTFCFQAFKDYPYRYRTPESIVCEMEILKEKYNINMLYFFNDLTFHKAKYCEEFSDILIQKNLGIYWIGNCVVGTFKDKDIHIIEKMKKAGCIGIGFALESADQSILNSMNKKQSAEDFKRQVRLFQKAGIHTSTSLVFGYPQETKETIKKSIECCRECKIYPSVGYLLPQPGTPMYEYAKKIGKITNEEEYLLTMGQRQDLRINLTSMDDETFQNIVEEELWELAQDLDIDLKREDVIKTRIERIPKSQLK